LIGTGESKQQHHRFRYKGNHLPLTGDASQPCVSYLP
jgi:hypothetical protein